MTPTAIPTKKTASLVMLEEYAQYMVPRMNALLQFHMDSAFRELRFQHHQARQKDLDSICKKFTKEAGRKTIVGFGDWSSNDPEGIIKGRPAGPANALKKHLCRHCPVVSIDEPAPLRFPSSPF